MLKGDSLSEGPRLCFTTLLLRLFWFPSAEVTFASDQTEGGRGSRQEVVRAGYLLDGVGVSSWIPPTEHIPDIWEASGALSQACHPQPQFLCKCKYFVWFSAVVLSKHCFRATWGAPPPQFLVQQAWVRVLEFAFITREWC